MNFKNGGDGPLPETAAERPRSSLFSSSCLRLDETRLTVGRLQDLAPDQAIGAPDPHLPGAEGAPGENRLGGRDTDDRHKRETRSPESPIPETRITSVRFAGVTSGRGELLQSPVSGVACVHWRLRIVEQINNSLQLVHEIASTEDFALTWSGTGAHGHARTPMEPVTGAVKIRVVPESARIQATPVLHRPGSPGALATGRQFGFLGQLSVEEVLLRPGEEITAEGFLEQPDTLASGPYRDVDRELELFEATVRLPARATLAPVLLPWALGTAAALLGGVGVAVWVARRFDLLPTLRSGNAASTAEIGPMRYVRRHFSQPE